MWAVAHETFMIHNSENAQTYILTSQASTPSPLKKDKLGIFFSMFGQLRKMKMGMNWSKIELFKNNFEKKNNRYFFLLFWN